MKTVDSAEEWRRPLEKGTADMAPTSTNLFKVEEANGVLTVTFSSGEPLNYLTITALNELDQLVTEWGTDPRYRAIVIQSDPGEVGFMTHFSAEELYDLIKAIRPSPSVSSRHSWTSSPPCRRS
jgi:enoyl-CoA hydratase/carnithine racemase